MSKKPSELYGKARRDATIELMNLYLMLYRKEPARADKVRQVYGTLVTDAPMTRETYRIMDWTRNLERTVDLIWQARQSLAKRWKRTSIAQRPRG